MTPLHNLASTFAERLSERIGLGRVFLGHLNPPPAPEPPVEPNGEGGDER